MSDRDLSLIEREGDERRRRQGIRSSTVASATQLW